MKEMKRCLFALIAVVCAFAGLNVSAAYSYSHDGNIISAPAGYAATNDGVYNVLSTAWGNNISVKEFNSPEDLFIYTETSIENGKKVEEDVIYVVSSSTSIDQETKKCYNTLLVFDGNLNYKEKFDKFEVNPDDFSNLELSKMKTRVDGSAATSSALTSVYSYEKIKEIKETPYEERTEDQKIYIQLLKVSGVYRAERAKRDSNNVVVEGEYEDLIYLCDTGNNQIVIIDAKTYKVVQVISAPTDQALSEKTFSPTKVVTDKAGRIYVISEGIYEGIILLNNKGEFMRFVGVNYTSMSFWDALWRNLATEEQRKQMTSILNTEFKNFTIDSQGFIYTVSRAVTNEETGVTDDSAMIKRINQAGKDVLVRNGYSVPKGDLITIRTGANKGGSAFSGITVNEYGVYTVVDTTGGRLFTYDKEGNLLYISGGKGSEVTDLANPVAVRYQGENLLVLEKNNRVVIRYTPTEVGRMINKAVEYQAKGDLEAASEEWQNVINQNPNYELAYVGVGKTYLSAGRYQDAMEYFKIGFNVDYYSKAYKLYRDDKIKKYFPFAMTAIVVLVVALIGYKIYKSVRYKKSDAGFGDE